MPFRDKTDEEIARAILKRLRDMGLGTTRQMAGALPVSRTTVNRWENGDYTMKGPTRAKCIRWLGEPAPEARPLTEQEERAVVANWMRDLARLVEGGAISRPATPWDEVRDSLDEGEDTEDEGGEPSARPA